MTTSFKQKIEMLLKQKQENKPAEVIFKLEQEQEVTQLIMEYLFLGQEKFTEEEQERFSHYAYLLSNPLTKHQEYEETHIKAKKLLCSKY
jgi:hypothetical protein